MQWIIQKINIVQEVPENTPALPEYKINTGLGEPSIEGGWEDSFGSNTQITVKRIVAISNNTLYYEEA
jgi:hypothetical protein